MWIPTRTEAVEMFARHFGARHLSGAVQRARDTARERKDTGDLVGYEVWCEVAVRVERLQNGDRDGSRDRP
jgi:hypothetical protein